MSSQAVGYMVVILPKDKVKDFEAYFDEQNNYAFVNTEIELTELSDTDKPGYERRVYNFSCSFSLESCLVEPEDNDIRDVCYNLGLQYLDIDAVNSTENFSENIIFENGICSYATKDIFSDYYTCEVKGKKREVEM